MIQKNFTRWLFVLPAVVVVLALFIYPISSSIFYSFTTKHLIKPNYSIIGLENYHLVLNDPRFWEAFINSLKWTIISLAGQILFGFTTALTLNHVRKIRSIYRTLLIIPWAFPTIVIALSWKWILNGVYGFLPHFLHQLGLTDEVPQFFVGSVWPFLVVVFVNVWFGAPLIMVNVLAALQTVPRDRYEAAKIDGATSFQRFLYITMPHIKMVVGLLVVLRTVWVFNNFDIIYLTTGGGPAGVTTTLPLYAYDMAWGTKLLGVSSAVTVMIFIFLVAVCIGYFTVISRWEKKDMS